MRPSTLRPQPSMQGKVHTLKWQLDDNTFESERNCWCPMKLDLDLIHSWIFLFWLHSMLVNVHYSLWNTTWLFMRWWTHISTSNPSCNRRFLLHDNQVYCRSRLLHRLNDSTALKHVCFLVASWISRLSQTSNFIGPVLGSTGHSEDWHSPMVRIPTDFRVISFPIWF